MKKLVYLITIMIVLGHCVNSCSDNDDTVNSGGNVDGLYIDSLAEDAYIHIITHLCDIHEDTTGLTQDTLEIKVGEVLDESNPYTRSIGFDSIQQADEYFLSIVPQDDGHLTTTISGYKYEWKGIGSLEYVRVNQKQMFSYIEINLDSLPELKRIEFIPLTLWPDNGSSSYLYQIGDLVIEKKTGYKYVCVANYNAGRDGILMTFDGGWWFESTKSHGYRNEVMHDCASEEAWKALVSLKMERKPKWDYIIKNYYYFIHWRYRGDDWKSWDDWAYCDNAHIGTGAWKKKSWQKEVYFEGTNGMDLRFKTNTWHTISHWWRYPNNANYCSHEKRFNINKKPLNRSDYNEIYISTPSIKKVTFQKIYYLKNNKNENN